MLGARERAKWHEIVADRRRVLLSCDLLQPGDRRPTETQRAARYGVSRLGESI